jgi:hypothetical protein
MYFGYRNTHRVTEGLKIHMEVNIYIQVQFLELKPLWFSKIIPLNRDRNLFRTKTYLPISVFKINHNL